tara:strand:- start:150 stop:518 length:369 start_codon:yes stop_codon:yes gene_type:complete
MSYIKKINRFFILGILILCVFSINSCSKKKDTLAVIEVLDSVTESPIINSSVRLFYVDASGSSKFDLSKNTNSNGFVTFDFSDSYNEGQSGFIILDVEVDGIYLGVINIEELTTTKKIIYVL